MDRRVYSKYGDGIMRKIKIEGIELSVAEKHFKMRGMNNNPIEQFLVTLKRLEDEAKTSLAPVKAKYEETLKLLDTFFELKIVNGASKYEINHNGEIKFSDGLREPLKKKYLDFLIRKTLREWNFDLLQSLEYIQKRYGSEIC